MPMVSRVKVRTLLKLHEGFRAKRYKDTRGIWSIGEGFNLEAPGARQRCQLAHVDYDAVMADAAITPAQGDALMDYGIESASDVALMVVHGFLELPENAQLVCIDMLFNLGSHGFAEFHKFIAAVERRDWPTAVAELRASLWYGQVGQRAKQDEALILGISDAA